MNETPKKATLDAVLVINNVPNNLKLVSITIIGEVVVIRIKRLEYI